MNRPSNGQALRPAKRPFLSSQGTAPCGINTFCCRIDCLQDLQDLMSSFEPFNKSQQPPGPPRQGTAAPFEAPTSKRQRSTEDFHQIPDLCLRSCEPLCKFIAKAKFPPPKKYFLNRGIIATQCLVHFPNTRELSQHKWSTRTLTLPHVKPR